MSKRLAVNDTTALAFGFTWQALDPVESLSSKLSELLSQGNRWQATFKRGRTEYLGVSKEDFTPLPNIKTVSGAALMANHEKLVGQTVWIVMEEPIVQEEGGDTGVQALESEAGVARQTEMVVVGLLNGNIVIDDYVNRAGYQKQLAAFMERCAKAKARYTLVGTTYTVGQPSQPYTWADFLPSKGNKAVPIKTLEPSLHGRILLGIGATAVIFGLAWAYVAWDNAQKAKAEELRREKGRRNIPALYTANVSSLLEHPVLRANSAFGELRARLHDFPVRLAGWRLTEISCTAESASCKATWSNANHLATNRHFAEAAPKAWGSIELQPAGDTLSHNLPFKLTTAAVPPRSAWPTERDFLLRQFSQWQNYWVIGFRPQLAGTAHVVGLVPGLDEQAAMELPDAVWATQWSIKETPWFLAEAFDRTPDKGDGNLPDSATVDTITLKLDQDQQPKFEAEGRIYERK